MAGPAGDVPAPPDSRELADVDDSMRRLMLSSTAKQDREGVASPAPAAAAEETAGVHKVEEDSIAQVDQFLREALQNSRERLSANGVSAATDILLEIGCAPCRSALLSTVMVLPESNFPDGSNSIRLADIPVNLPSPDNNIVNVAIKQRTQKRSQNLNILTSGSINSNSSKSVEERKEEYNRARARIFYSNGSIAQASRKPEMGLRYQENSSSQQSSLGFPEQRRRSRLLL